jgi:hypothetical protein
MPLRLLKLFKAIFKRITTIEKLEEYLKKRYGKVVRLSNYLIVEKDKHKFLISIEGNYYCVYYHNGEQKCTELDQIPKVIDLLISSYKSEDNSINDIYHCIEKLFRLEKEAIRSRLTVGDRTKKVLDRFNEIGAKILRECHRNEVKRK